MSTVSNSGNSNRSSRFVNMYSTVKETGGTGGNCDAADGKTNRGDQEQVTIFLPLQVEQHLLRTPQSSCP